MLKELLNTTQVLWALFVRVLAGAVGILLMTALLPERKKIVRELYPSKTWQTLVPASIISNYLATMAWLAGMKYTLVSVAAVLNQLSAIFVIIFAAMFLDERITPSKLCATFLAVLGAILVGTAV